MKPFYQLSGREKAIEVLRWLLVPVAAAAAFFVLVLIARVALPPAMAQPPGMPQPPLTEFRRIAPRIFDLLISGAIVFAGAQMAPRWRLATAWVLAGLWIGYSFLSHVYVHLGRGQPNYLDFALALGATLLAVALVGYAERVRGRGLDVPFAKR